MFRCDFGIHHKCLGSLVMRSPRYNRGAIRLALERDERWVAEKNASGSWLQHPLPHHILRRFELLSVPNGFRFHSTRPVPEKSEHDSVMITPPRITETHPLGHEGADFREQLRPGRAPAWVSNITDDSGAQ